MIKLAKPSTLVDMNKLQVTSAIQLATGKRVSEVAKDNGYDKTTFYRAIEGRYVNSPLYELISDLAKMPKHILWPQKFTEENQPELAEKETK